VKEKDKELRELRKKCEELMEEVKALDRGILQLLGVIEVAEKKAETSVQDCEKLWQCVEELQKEVDDLDVLMRRSEKENVVNLITQAKWREKLHEVTERRSEFEDSLAVLEYLEDFSAPATSVRVKIDKLRDRSRVQRSRLSQYDALVRLYGDSLEDIVLAKLVKNTVSWRKAVTDTNVGHSIVQNTKLQLVKMMKLTPEETWDLQIKANLTDEQLDKVRKVLGQKREGLDGILCCSKTSGQVRRQEQKDLFEQLHRKKTSSGGTYFSVRQSMRLLIDLYGGGREAYGEEKMYRWKLSIDGRKISGQDQVMMGITPLDFGLAVQSCYNTFPIAIVCGKEDYTFLKSEWKELFAEVEGIQELGYVVEPVYVPTTAPAAPSCATATAPVVSSVLQCTTATATSTAPVASSCTTATATETVPVASSVLECTPATATGTETVTVTSSVLECTPTTATEPVTATPPQYLLELFSHVEPKPSGGLNFLCQFPFCERAVHDQCACNRKLCTVHLMIPCVHRTSTPLPSVTPPPPVLPTSPQLCSPSPPSPCPRTPPLTLSFPPRTTDTMVDCPLKQTTNKKRVLERRHKISFVLTTDLSSCWVIFNFAGSHSRGNCIYCDVDRAADRGVLTKKWATWSRVPALTTCFGVPATSYVFCTLHALLRVIEFLMQWVFEKVADGKKLNDLYRIMTTDLGVGFKLYTDKKDNVRVQSYNGGQCAKILANVEKIVGLVADDQGRIVHIWIEFRRIFEDIQSGIFHDNKGQEVTKDVWNARLLEWGKQYVFVHGASKVRIYVHIIIHHAGDVVEVYGALEKLSQQGFEAANALQAVFSHHHSDHHWGKPAKASSDLNACDQVIGRTWMLTNHEQLEPAKKRNKGVAALGKDLKQPIGCGWFLQHK
jgi:hypothetical protein